MSFYQKIKLMERLEKFSHPIITALGTIFFSLGCAFIGSYKTATEWESVGSAATFIAFVLTWPIAGLVVGGLLYFLNELGRHSKVQKIEKSNTDHKEEINKLNLDLDQEKRNLNFEKQKINNYQESMQRQNEQILELQKRLAESWLKQAFKQHDMNSCERVSIYFELNKEFTILARHSSNPNYKEIHNQKFGLNDGVISQAWSHGEWVENNCPEYIEVDPKNYVTYMTSCYKYSEEKVQRFLMKSCWYVAVAISSADDNVGVIVFESTKQNFLNEEQMRALINYCKQYQSHLVKFIEESKALEIAKQMEQANRGGETDQDVLKLLGQGGDNK